MRSDANIADAVGVAIVMPEDPADRRVVRRIRMANVLFPGAGLIRQDHVLFGVLLGLLFWVPLAGAFYGTWIAPAVVPVWLAFGLTGLAVAAYLAGQMFVLAVLDDRARRIADYAAGIVPPMRAAYAAISQGDWVNAQIHLEAVLAFDPENFEANLTQARLLALQRRDEKARTAYARCRRLDPHDRWQWEIERELALLAQPE